MRVSKKPETSSTLVELARVILHGGPREPTRSLMQLISRLAPFCLRAAVFIIIVRGSAGAPVASQLLYLLGGLVALAAVDQWFAVPVRRGFGRLARFVASIRARRDSSRKTPPGAQVDHPSHPEHPDPAG